MPTLLIAVRSESLACALRRQVHSHYQIHTCHTPEEMTAQISKLRPDALIADARLLWTPEQPHLRIPHPHPPAVLVLTDIATESILSDIYTTGAHAVMRIPCKPEAVARTLEYITKEVPRPEHTL